MTQSLRGMASSTKQMYHHDLVEDDDDDEDDMDDQREGVCYDDRDEEQYLHREPHRYSGSDRLVFFSFLFPSSLHCGRGSDDIVLFVTLSAGYRGRESGQNQYRSMVHCNPSFSSSPSPPPPSSFVLRDIPRYLSPEAMQMEIRNALIEVKLQREALRRRKGMKDWRVDIDL